MACQGTGQQAMNTYECFTGLLVDSLQKLWLSPMNSNTQRGPGCNYTRHRSELTGRLRIASALMSRRPSVVDELRRPARARASSTADRRTTGHDNLMQASEGSRHAASNLRRASKAECLPPHHSSLRIPRFSPAFVLQPVLRASQLSQTPIVLAREP